MKIFVRRGDEHEDILKALVAGRGKGVGKARKRNIGMMRRYQLAGDQFRRVRHVVHTSHHAIRSRHQLQECGESGFALQHKVQMIQEIVDAEFEKQKTPRRRHAGTGINNMSCNDGL